MIAFFIVVMMIGACTIRNGENAGRMNQKAYDFRYRNLDSTTFYAQKALQMEDADDEAKAEALNNLAFVSTARMQYDRAALQLDSIRAITDNQIELLIADIQQMRLCQRQSRNKDFYTYRESAIRRLRRIGEEESLLDEHLKERLIYARSELSIVTSTYYYYVGLEQQSVEAINEINPYGEIAKDTAQLLNYLYNVGAGGSITQGTQEEINQKEMESLFRCYQIAEENDYPFWMANSLQAMSEHLVVPQLGQRLIDDNYATIMKVNVDGMPDNLIAGNFATRSLDIFEKYGDIYQTAGSWRTLSQCYWHIGDYESSLECLNSALNNDTAIFRAPDLVASIQEQLSVLYAALNDKTNSHLNRNLYLDTQDKTRQDLYLQSRADQLNQSVRSLNFMIIAILILMILGVAMLFVFTYMRRRNARQNTMDSLLKPLEEWKTENEEYIQQLNDKYEETMEEVAMCNLHIDNNKRLNLEQRAKVSLVNMVTPYLDRMLHEINRLKNAEEESKVREERYAYVAELTERIIDYNDILTQWIQLRKGDLSLKIESFPLQDLFDILAHSRTSFQMKNIDLMVNSTDQWVKADKILTLFMINTIADNARKFTQEGGKVTVGAKGHDEFVEIEVIDNGIGMSEKQVTEAFSVEKNLSQEETGNDNDEKRNKINIAAKEAGHGFGLVNCKGIIEKYKKISSLFKVCEIGVESQQGRGSRFYFRLPKGAARTLMALGTFVLASISSIAANVSSNTVADSLLAQAKVYADSVYTLNAEDNYQLALRNAQIALSLINGAYAAMEGNSRDTLVLQSDKSVLQAEILWYHDKIPVDYQVILGLRNEIAVAALALHEWAVYRYNNKVYTLLYKEMSADNTLADYCSMMQKSESNKYMAIVILIILSLLILLAYFMLYYRHVVYYRFCLERVKAMNDVLMADKDNVEKLAEIERLVGNTDTPANMKGNKRKSIYDDERLPEQLQNVANELIKTLKSSINDNKKKLADIDLAEDEVRKLQFENDRLHVSNSVLDNCLSTLKHETMYYPSRIRTLLDEGDMQLQNISELADYYKQLYTLLSAQAMRQVESVKPECVAVSIKELFPAMRISLNDDAILGDRQMLGYLFELLRKQGKGNNPVMEVVEKNDRYLDVRVNYNNLKLSEQECHELFNPDMGNLPFLLCRQIVRDIGETTNARGCGITAEVGNNGNTCIVITLVRARKNKN